jgi:hypothetical protein
MYICRCCRASGVDVPADGQLDIASRQAAGRQSAYGRLRALPRGHMLAARRAATVPPYSRSL